VEFPQRWSHEIRCLVGGYRVAVPELASLVGFDGTALGA